MRLIANTGLDFQTSDRSVRNQYINMFDSFFLLHLKECILKLAFMDCMSIFAFKQSDPLIF